MNLYFLTVLASEREKISGICVVLIYMRNGIIACRGKENKDVYRDEGSRQEEQSHNRDDLHGDRLCLCLTSNMFHFMGHVLHLFR